MTSAWDFVKNTLANFIINLFTTILPSSPFRSFMDYFGNNECLGYINYFVPVNTFVAILEAWVSCILAYYVFRFMYSLVMAAINAVTNVIP